MAKKIIRGSGSMSLEEALNSPSYGNSYSIESVTLDPAMSQEVTDILTDNLPDNGFYFLGQAEVCAKEAWEWGNECQRLINERNQKIRTCKALASSRGGEAIDYWNVMSMENDVGDFFKKVWETIKNAIKKLIIMIINFIKSVGNFIKGAIAKAQELFYKKYARELADAKTSKGTMKIKAFNANKIWKSKRPDQLLKVISSTLVSAFNACANGINSLDLSNIENSTASNGSLASMIGSAAKVVETIDSEKKMIKAANAQTTKWFPSAAAVVNVGTYGIEKPGKYEVKIETILAEGAELLAPGTLQVLSLSLKMGQTGNKALSMILKKTDQAQKVMINEAVARKEGNKYEGKAAKNVLSNFFNEGRRCCQLLSTLLLHTYGNALSARMMVFSAAKKKVKGSSKADKEQAKKDAKAAFGK